MDIGQFINERACSQCGKKIYPPVPSEWVYKYKKDEKMHYQCSYSCYLKATSKLKDGRRKHE